MWILSGNEILKHLIFIDEHTGHEGHISWRLKLATVIDNLILNNTIVEDE